MHSCAGGACIRGWLVAPWGVQWKPVPPLVSVCHSRPSEYGPKLLPLSHFPLLPYSYILHSYFSFLKSPFVNVKTARLLEIFMGILWHSDSFLPLEKYSTAGLSNTYSYDPRWYISSLLSIISLINMVVMSFSDKFILQCKTCSLLCSTLHWGVDKELAMASGESMKEEDPNLELTVLFKCS